MYQPSRRRNVNLSVQSNSFPQEENARQRSNKFFFRRFYLKTKRTANIITGGFSKSDEGSFPKTFGVMVVTMLVHSSQKWGGKP